MPVSFCNNKHRWRAEIFFEGARMHVGYFMLKEDAQTAFDAVMEKINAGKIPDRLRTKQLRLKPGSRKYGNIELSNGQTMPKTQVVIPLGDGRKFTIESNTRVIVSDAWSKPSSDEIPARKRVMFLSLPRVKWLERPVI